MQRKRLWFWITLFVLVVVVLALLAWGWTVTHLPLPLLITGSIGFLASIGALVLFFVKLLKEMRLNQVQSDFLASISHEFKTPIATLELCGNLLRTQDLSNSERDQLWDSHQSELLRLKVEVDRLLEAARWKNQAIEVDAQDIDLEAWLTRSLQRWRLVFGPKIQLSRTGGPLDRRWSGDTRLLDLIFDNLMDNARKFTDPSGTQPATVTIHTLSDGAGWRIEVKDNGRGFSEKNARRIFKRFVRGKQGHSRYTVPGTGLGLFIASSAASAMGLTLKGESPGLNQGACFTLEGPNV